jgi:hypothetical protein
MNCSGAEILHECWWRLREREKGGSTLEALLVLVLVTLVALAILLMVAVQAQKFFSIIGIGYNA